ncbi:MULTISPECIES: ArsR family transcriptional regulator [Metallosphaera]|uniref:DNA-binding protein n=3 Tax=Metallosphaera TaxID=41980 RepID=A0A088E1F4_9CREN|nr:MULTISPECIES: ArsR family transcriptional regulator [Metallosphaera]ABP94307.1 putative transcriptional regulator [Metallosphaera sedula DSM 5348]AIM26294.1 putative transcriptional regulator [Metallosphaera sedula]AKV73307.1 DNA-binding protein [Metallosphaera sedula]AKV75551.1 DNA-binding protein [Metallosphaera sedula]AKV77797.1 DNA-binding protein [Metallosphaera sedula]
MTYKGHLTAKEKILLVLAEKGSCSLEELEKYTRIKRNVLLVHLTRLAKEGLVYRGWGHFGGKTFRKYSLKSKYKEELKLE